MMIDPLTLFALRTGTADGISDPIGIAHSAIRKNNINKHIIINQV